MKYTIPLVLAAVAIVIAGCEQTIDYEKERTAIINVIKKETQSYIDRDFEAMYSTHVHDSLNMRLTAGADNYVFAEGWEQVARHMSGDETEDDLGPDLHITVEKTNFRMKIYPQSAFVVCDQKWITRYDMDTIVMSSIQVRFLEKIEGEWKISFVSFVGTDGYGNLDETEELFDEEF